MNHSEFLWWNVTWEILILQVIIKIFVVAAAVSGIEKYHKGCNLVILLY